MKRIIAIASALALALRAFGQEHGGQGGGSSGGSGILSGLNTVYAAPWGSDAAGSGSKTQPVQSFTNALKIAGNLAVTNPTIFLESGYFPFPTNTVVTVNNLTISGAGPFATRLAAELGQSQPCLVISANNVTIQDLTLGTNLNNGTYDFPLVFATLTNYTFTASRVNIENDSDGLYAFGNYAITNVLNATFKGCWFHTGYDCCVVTSSGLGTGSTVSFEETKFLSQFDLGFLTNVGAAPKIFRNETTGITLKIINCTGLISSVVTNDTVACINAASGSTYVINSYLNATAPNGFATNIISTFGALCQIVGGGVNVSNVSNGSHTSHSVTTYSTIYDSPAFGFVAITNGIAGTFTNGGGTGGAITQTGGYTNGNPCDWFYDVVGTAATIVQFDNKGIYFATNTSLTGPLTIIAQPGGGWSNSAGTTAIVGAHAFP